MKAVKYSTVMARPTSFNSLTGPKPTPQDKQILVRVYETIVTPSDVAGRSGSPFLIRFFSTA
jgi:NADPH:quinone reductase-like Zn-dependent oxidoreductase